MDDYEDIRTLIARHAWTYDSGDFDGFADLYAHAVFSVAPSEWIPNSPSSYSGRDEIYEWIATTPLNEGVPGTRHFVSNTEISIDSPCSASARSYFVVFEMGSGCELEPVAIGRYADTFEHVGSWRFATRTLLVDRVSNFERHVRPG